jgi:hypothetical protein
MASGAGPRLAQGFRYTSALKPDLAEKQSTVVIIVSKKTLFVEVK